MFQADQNTTNFSMSDVKKYFYLFWSWTWLILLVGLLAGGAAYYISIRTTPIYQSSTKLLVSNPPNIGNIDTTSLVADYNMIGTYAEMLTDTPVMQGVIDKLKLTMSPDELQSAISVKGVVDTQLLVVTVLDRNPSRAADIANTIGTVFSQRVRDLQAQRYESSLTGLNKQISDMEQQISSTKKTIATTTDPSTLAQLQDQLSQYQDIYNTLLTSYQTVRLVCSPDEHRRGRFGAGDRLDHPGQPKNHAQYRPGGRGGHAAGRGGGVPD